MASNSVASLVPPVLPPVPPPDEPELPEPDVEPLPPEDGGAELPLGAVGDVLADVLFDDCPPPQPARNVTNKHTENKAVES
jgi:hypothetical protein